MISYTTGNILESGADCLVNTVNCEGYMGKGIAYQFKLKYPRNYEYYVKECRAKRMYPGRVLAFCEDGKMILNFPTKDKWREKSSEEYIENGMSSLVKQIVDLNIKSIAIPPLGCGNGGLDWNRVKEIIERHIQTIKNKYEIIIYQPTSEHYTSTSKEAPRMSSSALLLIDIKRALDKPGKLRLQKAAFAMNYYWGNQYFVFKKGEYGPYSHAIDIIVKRIGEYKQHYHITDTNELYSSIYQTICSKKTNKILEESQEAIKKATEFVNTIKSDHALEGIATALYLVMESNQTHESLWNGFIEWPGDKASRFQESELADYEAYLVKEGMIKKSLIDEYEIIDTSKAAGQMGGLIEKRYS